MREKFIEGFLSAEVKKHGGWSIKLSSAFISGMPDRLVLIPEGKAVFVELKALGKKVKPVQEVVHDKLKNLGFPVLVIDSKDKVKDFINDNF